jgi:flagellar hook assembly protein FlgD
VRTLVDDVVEVGEKSVIWNGRNAAGRAVSSGSYFVRLQGERISEVRKVMLVR